MRAQRGGSAVAVARGRCCRAWRARVVEWCSGAEVGRQRCAQCAARCASACACVIFYIFRLPTFFFLLYGCHAATDTLRHAAYCCCFAMPLRRYACAMPPWLFTPLLLMFYDAAALLLSLQARFSPCCCLMRATPYAAACHKPLRRLFTLHTLMLRAFTLRCCRAMFMPCRLMMLLIRRYCHAAVAMPRCAASHDAAARYATPFLITSLMRYAALCL